MFLRLMFADEMKGSTGPLVALGAVSLMGQAALASQVQPQQAVQKLKQRTAFVTGRCRIAAISMASGETATCVVVPVQSREADTQAK